MDPSLPPFGIRHLCDGESYSVLQVTETQYQSTIKSHPDATLSYVDEDDGEGVTVGSSLELKQRLEDPVAPTAPLVYCYNSARNEFEDRFIHLFDIQRTSAARTAWREHQAGYTKSQDRRGSTTHEKEDTDSISSIDINASYQENDEAISVMSEAGTEPQVRRDNSVQTDLNNALSEAIPDLVENLANLLQSTSETLRKAATKSRTSNTSPIEDVLSGVSNIITEIGGFGLSMLDKLNEKDTESFSVPKVSQYDPLPSSASISSESPQEEHNQSAYKPDDQAGVFAFEKPISHSQFDCIDKIATANTNICDFCSESRLQCRASSDCSDACHNCATLGEPCSFATMADSVTSTPSALPHNSRMFTSYSSNKKHDSILDEDTEDADFSRRYPPLMSLRRANTIAGLHDHYSEPKHQELNEHGVKRHSSWVRRYPHRPIPYVLDSETQRRRDFARNCYPAQEYTPGPGIQDEKPMSTWKVPNRDDQPIRSESREQSTFLWQPSNPASIILPRLTASEIAATTTQPLSDSNKAPDATTATKAETITLDSPSIASRKSLPGAWPEFGERQSPIVAPAGESSGAFFNRMMRDNPTRRQRHAPDANERLTRHRSFSRQRPANTNPFSELNRSHTLAGATNPASRLNRPFDPFYPAVAKRESITLPQKQSNQAPCPATQSPIRLGERQASIPRSFSPVWEDQTKDKDGKLSCLDQNGESSSMYSPPPRHMRSVPNFWVSDLDDATLRNAPTTSDVRPNPRHEKGFASNTQQDGRLPTSQPRWSTPYVFRQDERPSALFETMPIRSVKPISSKSGPATIQPHVQSSASKCDLSKGPHPDSALHKCLTALQDMGYGLRDPALKSRLHVYAEAANGDVMEAVDMIEEDKKANFGTSAKSSSHGYF